MCGTSAAGRKMSPVECRLSALCAASCGEFPLDAGGAPGQTRSRFEELGWAMLMRSVILAVVASFSGAAAFADPVYKVGHVAAADVLNVRQGPSVDFDILMGLPPDYRGVQKLVCVLVKPNPHGAAPSRMPEWCMIADQGGALGWVNARFLVADTAPPVRLRLVAGYRSYDDACRLVGESEEVVDYLDHTADLVACPEGHPGVIELQQEMGAQPVAELDGYVLLSIPQG